MSSAACALSAPAWGAPSDSILRCFAERVQPQGFGVGVDFGLGFAFAFGFGVGVGVGFGDGSGFSVGVGVGAGVGAAVTTGVGVGPAGGLGETGAAGTRVDPGGRGAASVAAAGNGDFGAQRQLAINPASAEIGLRRDKTSAAKPANCGPLQVSGKSRGSKECVVGPGGLEPPTRPL